jgi:hypothetical protein
MINQIEFLTLDFKTLAQTMGETETKAYELLQNFFNQTSLELSTHYTFELVIKQGTKRNVIYVAYAPVPEGTKAVKDVQIVTLKHNNFFKVTLTPEEYLSFIDGELKKDMDQILKLKGHDIDFTKLFGLIQKHDDHVDVYMQYK